MNCGLIPMSTALKAIVSAADQLRPSISSRYPFRGPGCPSRKACTLKFSTDGESSNRLSERSSLYVVPPACAGDSGVVRGVRVGIGEGRALATAAGGLGVPEPGVAGPGRGVPVGSAMMGVVSTCALDGARAGL